MSVRTFEVEPPGASLEYVLDLLGTDERCGFDDAFETTWSYEAASLAVFVRQVQCRCACWVVVSDGQQIREAGAAQGFVPIPLDDLRPMSDLPKHLEER